MAVHSHRMHSITTYSFEQMYPGLKGSLQKIVLYTYELGFCATNFFALFRYKGKMLHN